MAEDDLLGGAGDIVGGFATGAADVVMIILAAVFVLAIIVGLIVLIKLFKAYKIDVKIRVVTANRKRIVEDKAREVLIDGVPFWKLRKRKDVLPVPPEDAIELTDKGRLYAECYHTDEQGYTWIVDSNKPDKGFDPFTTVQRALYVQRLKNAQLRKKKGIWDLLQQFITPVILLLLFVLVLVFWQDIAQPTNEVLDKTSSILSSVDRITQQQARIAAVQAGVADPSTLEIQQDISGGGG